MASGNRSTASGSGSVALGSAAQSGGIADNNTFTNSGTVAIGTNAQAGATGNGLTYAIAIGSYARANAANAIAIGGNGDPGAGNAAYAAAANTIAIGSQSQATDASSVALGQGAQATAVGAVALGQGAVANVAGTVSVGTVGATRSIVNITAGGLSATSTDAVNGSQLFATNQQVSANTAAIARNITSVGTLGNTTGNALGGGSVYSTAGGVTAPTYTLNRGTIATNNVGDALTNLDGRTTTNTTNITALQNGTAGLAQQANGNAPITVGAATGGTVVNVAGTAGSRQITGVTAGAVTAASTDAVNGSQLFTLSQQAVTGDNNLGTTTAAAVGGGATYNPATSSITGPSYQLNGSATTFTNVVAGQQALANGAAGPLQYATRGTPSNALNLVGTGGTVTLGNVAAGAVAAGSTEAVNGGQLFSTNQQITALQSGSIGLVQQATPTSPITVGAAASGTLVSVAGTAGNRQITGVAAGDLSATSNDAISGSQLFATNQQVAGNSSAIGVLQGQTATNAGNIITLQIGQAGPFRDNNIEGSPAPSSTGANAIAGGFGSLAAGASSVAIGRNAQATMVGATAIGAGAIATADPTTAVGFNAAAIGNEASAFGAFASASGTNSTALGRSATAIGNNATATGFGSSAGGAGSVAIGVGASAQQANSVAIGTGAATTRANQVAIGTAGQTYALAGVTSAQSLSAQTGGTGFVTTDAAGNLASSNIGPSSIAALDGRVSSLEASFGALNRYAVETRREARQGIAAAMALSSAPLPSTSGRLSYVLNGATFHGEWAAGGAVAYRLDTNAPLAVTAGVGTGGGRNVGVRFGIMGEL